MLGVSEPPNVWLDWSFSNVLSAAQVVLTAAGFLFAWLQLRRTATAVETSRDLLDKLRIRLVANDLIVMLPDLHDLEDQLDDACSAKVKVSTDVERVLVRYSRKGGEILGIIEEHIDLKDDPLAKALRQAVTASVRAKSELAQGSTRTLLEVVENARRKISTVSHEASSMRSRLQRKGE